MGFRFRKSLEILPGIRLNLSKSGIGASVGGKGFRRTYRVDGRVTNTYSIPGTGISYVENAGRISSPSVPSRPRSLPEMPPLPPMPEMPDSAPRAPTAPTVPEPGRFAHDYERALYEAVRQPSVAALEAVIAEHPQAGYPAAIMVILLRAELGDHVGARVELDRLWPNVNQALADPLTSRYLPGMSVYVAVAEGVQLDLPLSHDALGLFYAELLQAEGYYPNAIAIVEDLTPTSVTAISLADLYCAAARWQDVIDLTENITNTDDSTAVLCLLRARAFRNLGYLDAATELLSSVTRTRSRSATIRHHAMVDKAQILVSQGKPAAARTQYEKVLAEDSNFPGLREAIGAL